MKTIFLILNLTVLTVISMAQSSEYSFKESYNSDKNTQLTFDTEDTDIKIMASEIDHIAVFYIVKRNNQLLQMTLDELDEYFRVIITKNPDGLMIKTRSKQNNIVTNWENRVTLDFKVLAPTETRCTLQTIDGDLAIKGLMGNQFFKTVDGDIKIHELTGDIEASTVDGDIELKQTIGQVNLSTTDGDIKLQNTKGNVNAKTVDGDIQFSTLMGGLTCATTDGDIKGSVGELKSPCRFKTSDGDIRVSIPKNVGFDIEMRGEDLKANLKNFDGNVNDDYINGKVNGGGVSMYFATGEGDINLDFE